MQGLFQKSNPFFIQSNKMKWFPFTVVILLVSCSEKSHVIEPSLFSLKGTSTGLSFENNLTYDEAFNPYLYRNFYNGGGVAIGDVNNDGLEDIYFTGNMVDNKLFLNKGNWQFEDITIKAGVQCPNVWSTGATFVDINGDGLLDLYVCKSGKPEGANRHNELFINNGDLTFTESSKLYGLDVEGLSVHAAFFDYDKDGDLDAYVLNNSLRSVGGFDLIKDQRYIPDENGSGNKFFRNDDGKFVDITIEAGIYTSKIGFGLGITLGDFNNDNWTDIYICNDFFERDYLYINDGEGKFTEELEHYFHSISMGAMGADFADLNNDLLPDLMVTEMLPATVKRQKTKTAFESWDKQQQAKKEGYFNQYSRNTLQRNIGTNQFMELGRKANVSASEWSWGALLFDMDNDGLKDIFVSNGIYKDLLDRDYLTYEANDEIIAQKIRKNEKNVITKLIDAMPSQAVPNAAFHNQGDFNFENKTADWGLATPSFSNGSAFGDLDNDGDLDLVVNNVNMPSFLYENTTDTLQFRSLNLKFVQNNKNILAIGTKAIIKYSGDTYGYGENFVSRGFESSVSYGIHFGVGDTKSIDSLWVTWPDGAISVMSDIPTNITLTLEHPSESETPTKIPELNTKDELLESIPPLFEFVHREDKYVDFNNERLLTQMYSNEGPAFATADLNEDGKADFFLGGAKGQSGALFLSSPSGYQQNTAAFTDMRDSEDTDALFFDGDNDGDLDLYVCHGGKAYSPYSKALTDSYYINTGGAFKKSIAALDFPTTISSSVIRAADFDNDGDQDLFVGERYKTNQYGIPGSGYLLENDGSGHFQTVQIFKDIGMITDAQWSDFNQDGWQDLVVSGEWMPLKIFINHKSNFIDESANFGLEKTNGLWSALALADIDADGDQDIIAGNIGMNNFFEADMRMFVADFDANGFQEQIICRNIDGKYYPVVDKDELISQLPALKKKLLYYKDYAEADMASIFTPEVLAKALSFDLILLESSIFYNENGKYVAHALPDEIQYAPTYAITVEDVNNDGKPDLFFGGNQYYVKPQFGRYDASVGWGIFGPYSEKTTAKQVFPLRIQGQIRGLKWIENDGEKILIAIINNEKTSFYKLKNNH
mgnify:CR=1 FL=1